MKSDNIYFGAEGITSTSANHVANMAKEMEMEVECHPFVVSTKRQTKRLSESRRII